MKQFSQPQAFQAGSYYQKEILNSILIIVANIWKYLYNNQPYWSIFSLVFVPKKDENTQKLLDKAIVQFLCNLYFMAKLWRKNISKRFRFEGQDLITNPNPNIICLAKITNSNPIIRYNTEKSIYTVVLI